VLTQTAPQAAVVIAHDDPAPRAARGTAFDDDIEPVGSARRRWPIVKSLLALLLLVIIGAGYAGWRYTQSQYYVGEDAGHVAIFHGINQDLAGLNLSSVYRRTEIPLAAVPATDQSMIRSTIAASSLSHAQTVVGTIRGDYQVCQRATSALTAYNAGMRAYTAKLNAYKQKHGTTTQVKTKAGKVIANPPVKPSGTKPTIPADCPSTGTGAGL
jgi:protein phosphatase